MVSVVRYCLVKYNSLLREELYALVAGIWQRPGCSINLKFKGTCSLAWEPMLLGFSGGTSGEEPPACVGAMKDVRLTQDPAQCWHLNVFKVVLGV